MICVAYVPEAVGSVVAAEMQEAAQLISATNTTNFRQHDVTAPRDIVPRDMVS